VGVGVRLPPPFFLGGDAILLQAQDQQSRYYADITDTSAVTPFGYDAIDSFITRGGIRQGQNAFILGRSGVGKTNFTLNLINRMLLHGHSVLFSSQEMTTEELVGRLIAIRYGIPFRRVEQTYIASTEVGEGVVKQYLEDFAGLLVYEQSRPKWSDLTTVVRDAELVFDHTPVVFQDYMQLMTYEGYPSHEAGRVPRLAEDAKIWAKKERVALIQLAQTGRANESGDGTRNHGHIALTKEDMMYGGEQSADYIIALYRPEVNPALHKIQFDADELLHVQEQLAIWRDKIVCQVVKNRHGDENLAGRILNWNKTTMQMEEQ
jgi:replicative DNA helicase